MGNTTKEDNGSFYDVGGKKSPVPEFVLTCPHTQLHRKEDPQPQQAKLVVERIKSR